MIPKVVHYCWFGKTELPEIVVLCMDSWKKYLPEYRIKRWDENNSPMNVKWVKKACSYQKYAFAADYVRLYALFNEGGVYFDTDMFLVKPIDELLINNAFLGFEDEWLISMGIIGCHKGDPFIKKCMENYHGEKFNFTSPTLITHLVTNLIRDKYPLLNGSVNQKVENLMIYKPDYFYPVHYSENFSINDLQKHIKPNTFTIHLWNKSWMDEFSLFSQKKYIQGFKIAVDRILRSPFLPLEYYKKLAKYLLFFILRK